MGVQLGLALVVVGGGEVVLPWASVTGAAGAGVGVVEMNPGLGVEGDGLN